MISLSIPSFRLDFNFQKVMFPCKEHCQVFLLVKCFIDQLQQKKMTSNSTTSKNDKNSTIDQA